MKNIFFFIFSIIFITGCAPAYNNSIVIEKPQQPLKDMLVVVEQPFFSPKNGDNLKINSALFTYNINMNKAASENFVQVMSDNGIHSKLIFVMPVFNNSIHPLTLIPNEEQNKWSHVLWLRHVKGKWVSSYGNYNVFFQFEAKIFDTNTKKMIWDANESDSGRYYGYFDWKNGQMYRDILYRLNEDKMIELNSSIPKI